jgi:hypothetical protein
LAPSSLNWTPATPTVDVAFAVSVTFPLTVVPFAGDVIVTVGADCVLGVKTVNSSTTSSETLVPPDV